MINNVSHNNISMDMVNEEELQMKMSICVGNVRGRSKLVIYASRFLFEFKYQ